MMRILAIDPATSCGFALLDGTNIISGVWDLSVKRDESRGMRLIRLRNKLNEVGKVDLLVFEVSKSHMSSLAAEVAGEIRGLITTFCHDNAIEYKGIHYSAIKKHATGKGNANKEAMMAAARIKFNRIIDKSDEADALFLLDFARQEHNF
jgi:Holliday junction resolvasome RuvABC endonuclease subunit